MIRTRTRTRVITGMTDTYGTDEKGTILGGIHVPKSQVFTLSTLTDTTGNRFGSNPCRHVHMDVDDCSMSLPRTIKRDGSFYYQVSVSSIFAHYNPAPEPNGLPIPDMLLGEEPYYIAACNELMRDALGAMPTNVNLLVNAAEFASVKTLVPQILKIGRNLIRNKLGRRSLKELANGHLLHSFGIRPLITDIKGFLNIRSAVQDRIRELERRNLHKVRLVKRTGLRSISSSGYSGTFSALPDHLVTYQGKVEGTVEGTVSCECSAFYNTASPGSQCKLWASALGLSTPLQSIWELIPFSFVFDWFVPIGDTFQRLEDKLGFSETAASYTLTDFAYSKTTKTVAKAYGHVTSTDYPAWTGRAVKCPTFKAKAYVRALGIPAYGQLIPPFGWSVNKSALSLSLIAQKVL